MDPQNEEQITLKSSSDFSKSDRTENINDDQIDDQIDDEELQESVTSKMARKKVKCSYPIFLLLFFAMLQSFQVSPCDGRPLGVKCPKDSDIKIKNKTTGLIESCMPCPDCPPSEQYSMPCGSTVGIGTSSGRCVDCPGGTFSTMFDTNPCKVCTECTNKVYLKKCTKKHNAKCGGCKEGYKYNHHNFDCIKVPTTPSPPTARPSQGTTVLIPTVTEQKTTDTSTSTAVYSSLTPTPTTSKEESTQLFINYTLPTPAVTETPEPSSNSLFQGKAVQPQNTNQQTHQLLIIVVSAFCVIFFILGIVGLVFLYKKYSKKKHSRELCHCMRSRGDDTEGTRVHMDEMTNDGSTLLTRSVCIKNQTLEISPITHKLRQKLKIYLDPKKPMGKDYQDLADSFGYASVQIQYLETRDSPTVTLLEQENNCTIQQLRDNLENLGRDDAVGVIDELIKNQGCRCENCENY